MPRPHLLLTVGTNPLPIVVAAYRLLEHFPNAALTLVTSPESEAEAEAILKTLGTKCGKKNSPTGTWAVKKVTSASSPTAVREKIEELLSGTQIPLQDAVHLHYTGGTKTMGVEALKTLLAAKRTVSDSYLDSASRRLVDGNGRDLSGRDERYQWNLSLAELARLHGLETNFEYVSGNRVHRYGSELKDGGADHQNPPSAPSGGWIAIARSMCRCLNQEKLSESVRHALNLFSSGEAWPNWPDPATFRRTLAFPIAGSTKGVPPDVVREWNDLPARINKQARLDWLLDRDLFRAGQPLLDPSPLSGPQFSFLCKLLCSQWLELTVLDCLAIALKKRRRDLDVCCGTRFLRPGDGQSQPRTFQLDVTGIAGYQLVVFSCTTVFEATSVRDKAFEAILRARQIGGDDARVVVVSKARPGAKAKVQQEIHDDIGSGAKDPPIVIWGLEELRDPDLSMEDYVTQNLRFPAAQGAI